MENIEKVAPVVLAFVAVALAAEPALAQFAGAGATPFTPGMKTLVNWTFAAGVIIALLAFIFACVMLYMRNLIGFIGGVFAVIVGGGLMAQAPTVVNTLTGLGLTM